MIICEIARLAAIAALVATLSLGHLTYVQILVTVLVAESAGAFFGIAERIALRQVVPSDRLASAVTLNQSRLYGAMLLGPPIGGLLFGLGRAYPFVADACLYLFSLVSLLLIRSPLQGERAERADPVPLHRAVAAGIAWLWSEPFLRTTSISVLLGDFTINALYLLVILVARERGASPAVIGLILAMIGVGGLIGALIAPWLRRWVPPRALVIGTICLVAVTVPLLAIAPNPLAIGAIYALMFIPLPAWNSVVSVHQLRSVPDVLQARVQGVQSMRGLGAGALGMLVSGSLLQLFTPTWTILALAGLMLLDVAFLMWNRRHLVPRTQ